ncbi:uncharacterized protein FYW61_019616 [Anableps anableps]
MRGETAVENGVEVGEHGGAAALTTSLERRPSVATLQNMLKRASHDPLRHHCNGGEWSAATDMDTQHSGQNGVSEKISSNPQNGDSADLIRTDPFFAYNKESTNKTNGTESAGTETSVQEDADPISVPTLKFLNSPQDLDYGIKTTENGAKLLEQLNVSQMYGPKDELFQPSSRSLSATARRA